MHCFELFFHPSPNLCGKGGQKSEMGSRRSWVEKTSTENETIFFQNAVHVSFSCTRPERPSGGQYNLAIISTAQGRTLDLFLAPFPQPRHWWRRINCISWPTVKSQKLMSGCTRLSSRISYDQPNFSISLSKNHQITIIKARYLLFLRHWGINPPRP